MSIDRYRVGNFAVVLAVSLALALICYAGLDSLRQMAHIHTEPYTGGHDDALTVRIVADTAMSSYVPCPTSKEMLLEMLRQIPKDAVLYVGYAGKDGTIKRLTAEDLK